MGFISNLFSSKSTEINKEQSEGKTIEENEITNDEVLQDEMYYENQDNEEILEIIEKEEIKEIQEIDDIAVFSPNKELLKISREMDKVTALQNLSKHAKELAYNSNLQKDDCEKLLNSIKELQVTAMEKIKNLSDPMQKMYELKRKCALISNHTFIEDEITYENLEQIDAFTYLSDESEILKQFEVYLPELFDLDEPNFTKLAFDFTDINNIYKKIKLSIVKIKGESEKLTKEITEYANVVNATKAKHRLSADWNGKKQPLMTLGQQLTVRRNQFIESENKINNEIANLSQNYPELHIIFRNNCKQFVKALDNRLETQIPDDNFQQKKNILKIKYKAISAIQGSIEQFILQADFDL